MMHTAHSHSKSGGPETRGHTLHHSPQYDLLNRLLGMDMDRPNSKSIIEKAKIEVGHSVLDVGCGTGNLTMTAAGYTGPTGSVHGIDPSPEMINFAKEKARRLGRNVRFELGVAEKLEYPEATFDRVISRLVIHHLPADLKRLVFAECYRVLKPGGMLLTADFNPPANPLARFLMHGLLGPNMMQIKLEEYPVLFGEAGFINIERGRTNSPLLDFVSGIKPSQ